MSKQAASAIKVHAANWSILGRNPNKVFTMAVKAGTAKRGDRFKAESAAGVVTTGTLDSIHKASEDGVDRWLFTKDAKSDADKAADKALRSIRQAGYWASDKGIETQAKITARQAKLAAGDTSSETSSETSQQVPAATVPTVTLAELIAGFVKAGLSVSDAVKAAETTLVELAAGLESHDLTSTPAVVAPAKRIRTAAQLANDARLRKGGSTPAASTPALVKSAQRLACDSCGKQDVLKAHAGHPALKVCGSCITADSATVAARAVRRAAKLSKAAK